MAQFAYDHPEDYKRWFNASNTVVILAAKDGPHLLNISIKLEQNGLKHSRFYEPDINNAMTSIAIVPSPFVKKYCSGLPLAGKSNEKT